MGIITFLKKRYHNYLIEKLNKFNKLSDKYSKTIDSYNESIQSNCNQAPPLNVCSFYSSYCGSTYFVEDLTMQYDLYYYYKSLYNRTISKIERLEQKLNKLNCSF